MLDEWYLGDDLANWTTWVAVGVGLLVAFLVYMGLSRIKARRRLLAFSSGDLPWEELLELLRARHRELAASGSLQENLPPDELLALLMSRLPARRRRREPEVPPEEREYLASGGAQRRFNCRRWGTPTEVCLSDPIPASDVPSAATLPSWSDPPHGSLMYGMVINRSPGGFAIVVDQEVEPTTILMVRPLDAPSYVPSVEIEVKHCRKVRRKFLIGCQSLTEVPWNVLVWFG
jgi:hypothetical protein